jgi:F-type H+-transporting ATPase subunit b
MKKFALTVALFLLAAPLGAQEEHAQRDPLSVEFGLMFWTLVVFGLLLAILWKFAWPQILGAVEAREQALAAQIAEAARNREESAKLLAEHQKLVADARADAHRVMTEARGAADKERAYLLEQAKQEQDAMLQRARRELQAERDRAIVELRREAVDLSLAAASKVVGERLGSETDRRIVIDYLKTLEGQSN